MKYGVLNIVLIFFFWIIFYIPTFAVFSPQAKLTSTFDDSNDRIYTNAAPIFKSHNLPAVDFAETALLDNGEDWVMTWEQILSLQNDYGWEIGSHSINHPYLTQVTDQQLETELSGSKQIFLDHGININSFATPYGDYNNKVVKAISRYYTSHRAAWGGANVFPATYNDYSLVVYEVKNRTTPTTVMTWIDNAITNKQWLVLLLHDVVDGTPKQYEYNKDNLKKIVDYAASKPIKVVTLTNGLQMGQGQNLVNNNSFENIVENFAIDWNRNNPDKVTIDTNTNGNAPKPLQSLKLVGGTTLNSAYTDLINIDSQATYILKMFIDGTTYTSGTWTITADEFNQSGKLLRTKQLWSRSNIFLGVRYLTYIPGSNDVTTIRLKFNTKSGANFTIYVDSVEFRNSSNETTPTPTMTPTPTIPPQDENLLTNGSFENVDSNGFATGWTRNNDSQILIDTNNNGSNPLPKNSLKINAGTTQYIAMGPIVTLLPNITNYELSYYLKTINYQNGGTAAWIDEFDQNNNWISGKWLGGQYVNTNQNIKLPYQPTSVNVRSVQVHLFTEENSNMTAFFDELILIRKK